MSRGSEHGCGVDLNGWDDGGDELEEDDEVEVNPHALDLLFHAGALLVLAVPTRTPEEPLHLPLYSSFTHLAMCGLTRLLDTRPADEPNSAADVRWTVDKDTNQIWIYLDLYGRRFRSVPLSCWDIAEFNPNRDVVSHPSMPNHEHFANLLIRADDTPSQCCGTCSCF